MKITPYITAFRRYWITVVGTFILIGSWYFEKVLTSKYRAENTKINANLEALNTSLYKQQLYDFISARTTIEKPKPFDGVSEMNLAVLDVIFDSKHLLSNSDGYTDTEQAGYDSAVAFLSELDNNELHDSLQNILIKNTNESIIISDSARTFGINQMYQVYGKEDTMNTWALIFYCLGIVLITYDKIRRTVHPLPDADSNEIKTLLSGIDKKLITLEPYNIH